MILPNAPVECLKSPAAKDGKNLSWTVWVLPSFVTKWVDIDWSMAYDHGIKIQRKRLFHVKEETDLEENKLNDRMTNYKR